MLTERIDALTTNKHIKAFVSQLQNTSDHKSKCKARDAIDDLVAHVLGITVAAEAEPEDSKNDTYFDHTAPNVFFRSLLQCTILHKLTHLTPYSSQMHSP